MLEERLEQDLKAALLAGDAQRVSVLRGLKSVLLNEKVATGKRETGLTDEEVLPIFSKEAKKRQESADLYKQGDDETRQHAELSEKKIIEEYLPAQLSEDEVAKLVDEAIQQTGASEQKDMGKVIGAVRAKAGAQADGGVIARLTKEKLGL
jgi:uncharacterized protein YqeY